MSIKYVPIYELVKKSGQSKQNIYRWIREGKISKEDIKVEERKVKRITVNENIILPIKNENI